MKKEKWQILPQVRQFLRKKPLGAAGGIFVLLLVLTAIFADFLATKDPTRTHAAQTLAPPNPTFWFGTDNLGRDVYSRIVHGARLSLLVGLGSTFLGSVIGGVVGLLSGYLGGKPDLIIQRIL
ncbi:MAG: hypothetical protein L0Y56_04305, partial [Nitrospira sp.]|nr:hypothetical protein [Nitrospira sp.]